MWARRCAEQSGWVKCTRQDQKGTCPRGWDSSMAGHSGARVKLTCEQQGSDILKSYPYTSLGEVLKQWKKQNKSRVPSSSERTGYHILAVVQLGHLPPAFHGGRVQPMLSSSPHLSTVPSRRTKC